MFLRLKAKERDEQDALNRQLAAQRAEAEARRRSDAEAEGQMQLSLLRQMQEHIDGAVAEARLMPQLLLRAWSNLQVAKQEFSERAFSPFWVAIEGASEALERYSSAISNVEYHSRMYLEARRGYRASPPTYEVAATYNDPSYIVSSMSEIVRKAQKDFEFSSIYEQRQTNTILRAGFASIVGAVGSLGDRFSRSIDDMGGRVVSEIRDMSDALTDAIDLAADRQVDAVGGLGDLINTASERAEAAHLRTTQNEIERELSEQAARRRFEADVSDTLHNIHEDVHPRR
jgi:hypothetical protein